MKTVYVFIVVCRDNPEIIGGVFSQKEKAQAWVDKYPSDLSGSFNWVIYTHVLDAQDVSSLSS